MGKKVYKAIFLALGVGTLGVMIYSIGLANIWLNIQKTGVWFVPVIGSWLLIYVLNAFAFKAIIQEPDLPATQLSFGAVLRLTITGYAINYITPFVGLGGEPYRIMELKPKVGIHKASSSVLLYSLMHMFSHSLFWLASVGLILAFVPVSRLLLAGCAFMVLISVLLGTWFIRVYRKGFIVSTLTLLKKLPLVKAWAHGFAQEKEGTLHEIDNQIRILYADRKPRFYSSLILEFVARGVGCVEIYCTALAIGLKMSWVEALVISSASSLFANLVFFFPMQLGTREGGLALALRSIGLPAASGIFIGVVTRIREVFWIMVGLALMNRNRTKTPDNPMKESGLSYAAPTEAQNKNNAW
ncbi:lysylphosphatidylglycerol synthase transmembrane domain-containing protein [Rhabdobacter roseus]|uniref:Uncharacterized membrane protein YbhN (UPF0104 family) n=1 Tax=Rhabdobacter roseus TaxID=1655419 RepID=A0A840TQK3_9BACT|nr:lysylphosphatidylglycerol synthase transmembrane domain-containing protein [Rhabdobacter roseus]MBB5286626.1 uncharacterized membrane protein YbhN (UPF0104 family) [Rhabdobacter roseus]